MALKSNLFRGDAKLEAAAASHSAHIEPGARGDHVRKIQLALNQLDSAGLDPDGVYGRGTADAVLAYKQRRSIINRSYQTQADNIVGVMTVAALDAEMADSEGGTGGLPIVCRSSNGTCAVLTQPVAGTTAFVTDPNIVFGITILLSQVRMAIAAAEFRLLAAAPHVTSDRQTLPTGPFAESARASLTLLDQVFGFFKLNNRRAALESMRVVFHNMNIVLNRSFKTDPLIAPALFVPNPQAAMETAGSAYTTEGGAFKGPKDRMANGLAANRIYICNNTARTTRRYRIMTAIHELAHFVSAGKGVAGITDPLNGFYFDPAEGSNLTAPEPTVSANAKKLAPALKIRDAEHYAAFAVLAARGRLT